MPSRAALPALAAVLFCGAAWAADPEEAASATTQAQSGQSGQAGQTGQTGQSGQSTQPANAGQTGRTGTADGQGRKPPPPPPGGSIGQVKPPKGADPNTTPTDTSSVKGGPSSRRNSLVDLFTQQVLRRIEVTGSRRWRFQQYQVTGDQEAFNLETSYGLGQKNFIDVGNVTFTGRNVLGLFNFDAVILDNRLQDPQSQRFSLDYARGSFFASLGDIQGRLTNTNRFTNFSKTLRGVTAGYKSGGLEVRAIQSEVRGEARTISLSGQNSPGPYFLQSNQIVRGTERIEVDGTAQEFGRDYTIDYDLGAITFVNRQTLEGRIIPPTSTIVASYETFGFSGSRGQLFGAGASYSLGRAGRIGLTMLTQRAGGESRLSTRLEKFQGFGAPGTPYFLQFEPLSGTEIVIRVDGVLQLEGADYTIDQQNRSIFFFTRFMPSTSNIDVLYTPRPTSTVNGDRQVWGLDYRVPLGSSGEIGVYQATGRLSNTPTPSNGTARGIDGRWRHGRLEVSGSLRDVPSSYIGIETTGFNRNEKAGQFRAEYQAARGLRTTFQHQNNAISQLQTGAGGRTTVVPTRFTLTTLSAAFTPAGTQGGSWELSHSRTANRAAGGQTQIDSTTLGTSRTYGKLQARLDLASQLAAFPKPGQPDTRTRLQRQGLDLRLSYAAGKSLSANGSASLSRLAVGGESSLGRDFQLGIGWRPAERLNAAISFTDSDPGSIGRVDGLTSGFGLGYDGNGFSSGAGGSFVSGVSRQQRVTLNGNWRPTDTLSFGFGGSRSRTQGGVSSNTETISLLGGMDWDPVDWLRVNGTLSLNRTRYLEQDLRSSSTTASFSLDGAPPGRLSFSLGGSVLVTGGGSEFAQDILQLDATVSWLVARRHALSLGFSDSRTTGYLPQSNRSTSLTYRYQIWRALALNVSYRWRDVVNRGTIGSTSGAYQSRGFDIELAFNFGR